MPVKANIFSSRPYAFLAEKIAAAPSEIDFASAKSSTPAFLTGKTITVSLKHGRYATVRPSMSPEPSAMPR